MNRHDCDLASLGTRAEFANRANNLQRRTQYIVLSAAVALLLGFGLLAAALPTLPLSMKAPLGFIGLTLLGGGFVFGIHCVDRMRVIPCPHCGCSLVGRDLSTIATGRCRQCQIALWSEDEPVEYHADAASPRMLTRADLSALRKSVPFPWRPTVISLLVAAAVGGMMWLLRGTLHDWWLAQWGAMTEPFLDPLLMAPSIIIAPIGWLVAFRQYERQRPAWQCPHCDGKLHGEFELLATGRCHHCGGVVLADPLPPVVTRMSSKPVRVSDLRDAHEFWQRWLLMPCFAGAIPAALWLLLVSVLIDKTHENWRIAAMLLCVPLQMGGIVLSYQWLQPRLLCPECQASLLPSAPLAMCTGNCPNCGCRVVNYETSGDAA